MYLRSKPATTQKILATGIIVLTQFVPCYGLDAGVTATATDKNEPRAMNIATQKAKAIAKKKYPQAKTFAVAVVSYQKNGLFVASVTLKPVQEDVSEKSRFDE
jgi:hypothetical protein